MSYVTRYDSHISWHFSITRYEGKNISMPPGVFSAILATLLPKS